MARIQKRIKKNMKPQQTQESSKPKAKENVGKDYLLIAVISFTVIVTVAAWSTLTDLNKALYSLLIISLSLTYVRRHFNLTEQQETWVDRGSIISMGFALALFAIIMYQQIFA